MGIQMLMKNLSTTGDEGYTLLLLKNKFSPSADAGMSNSTHWYEKKMQEDHANDSTLHESKLTSLE